MGMKYKDPNTGQLKEISLKAADTLPIGTIVDYDGEEVPEGWEEYGTDDYSTDETFTGKHWIDGKPIYRKIIHGSASNTANLDISNYIDNYNEMIDMIYKYSIEGDSNVYFGNINRNGIEQSIFVGGNNTQIIFRGSRNFSNFDIILEYTKTTD